MKIKLIAETAWHHEGDFEFMQNLVAEICKTEIDIVKLHLSLDLDEYMDKAHSAYDTLKNWMLTEEQWTKIIELIKTSDKELMLLYNDTKAVDFGNRFNPEIIEIHSVCLNDIHLLEKIKNTVHKKTKIVLGVGGSSLYEIENAIKILDTDNIVLMFGFQNYPTKYEDINFEKVRKTMRLFPNYEYGYADHCAWNEPNNLLITLLGASQGMHYVEKHVTTKHGEHRCDWNSAITIEMINELSEKLKIVEKCNGNGLLELNAGEKQYSQFGPMKKAAILNTYVKEGDVLNADIISFKRTEEISDLSQMDIINNFGQNFTSDLTRNTVLYKKHLKKK